MTMGLALLENDLTERYTRHDGDPAWYRTPEDTLAEVDRLLALGVA